MEYIEYNGIKCPTIKPIADTEFGNPMKPIVPTKMLVARDDELPSELMVYGTVDGKWLYKTEDGRYEADGAYVAELPVNCLVTNKELAKWCAEGGGQVHQKGASNIHTFYSYAYGTDDDYVTRDYEVRKFGTTAWVTPTRSYLGLPTGG